MEISSSWRADRPDAGAPSPLALPGVARALAEIAAARMPPTVFASNVAEHNVRREELPHVRLGA